MLDLDDCTIAGSALPPDFLRAAPWPHPLPGPLEQLWETVRFPLRRMGAEATARQVQARVLAPLATALGYGRPAPQERVRTREGSEDGGLLLPSANATLRAWAGEADIRTARGVPHRFSLTRVAGRVLRARDERAGLVAVGGSLHLMVCDPALPDSHLAIRLGAWRDAEAPPDSFRLLLGLACPAGVAALPGLVEAGRLHQARLTATLRGQARAALEGFLQQVLAHPGNAGRVLDARALWNDALVLIYRLLFILKLESDGDPGFSFAATTLWRRALSVTRALAPLARRRLDRGHDTGSMLEDGLRQAFRAFRDGLSCAEMVIAPLGGALFGSDTAPLLEELRWGDPAVAILLDRLLWTAPGATSRKRVHYGLLDVEDLGHIYEALLELEPGIAAGPMERLRRGKREIVRPAGGTLPEGVVRAGNIPTGRFYLRSGSARKAAGAYYTPHGLVHLLVRDTLGPRLAAISPPDDPDPAAILALRVVDPAAGSGHFLVEACRILAEALLAACRACDRLGGPWRERIAALPDPDGLLAAWLPSRAPGDGGEARALALCRRLVAMHCLHGVDRNPQAIALARLSLWLEAHAEGLPLTFLDHRLVVGDALAGPFMSDLATLPVGGGALDTLLSRGLAERLAAMHESALVEVRALGATLGRDLADLALKHDALMRLERVRAPLSGLARAWAGAAMTADPAGDDEWQALARTVAATGAWPGALTPRQEALCAAGQEALPWDLAFPDVFAAPGGGFDIVLGNPPWDAVQHDIRDFVAGHDLGVLAPHTRQGREQVTSAVLADPATAADYDRYREAFRRCKRMAERLYRAQQAATGRGMTAGNLDLYRLFAERALRIAAGDASLGLLLPGGFHANEGSTALRRLYLDNGLETCLSFENRAGLFDIDSRFRFAMVRARRGSGAAPVRCAFYLIHPEQAVDPSRMMSYDRGFLEAAGGAHLTFPELRGPADLSIARRLLADDGREPFGAWCRRRGIRFGCDLHMTADRALLVPLRGPPPRGAFVVHEGKTFHQYTTTWDTPPRFMVAPAALAAKPLVLAAAGHARVAFRDIARSTDERSMIATLLPPGVVAGHTATVEKHPAQRPLDAALTLCAVLNSFAFDWLARLKATTHLSMYLLDPLPMPALSLRTAARLAEIAAALCRLHAATGSAPALRAEADAIVAHGYGLARSEYAHMLAGFSHRRWPAGPAACLAAYDRA